MPIVAAVDRSDRTESVVDQARDLADAYGVALHVVHVGEADVSRIPDAVNTGTVDETHGLGDLDRSETPHEEVRQARDRAERTAASIVEEIDGDDVVAVGLVGDPAPRLLDYATENEAEFVVVGGRKRSPVGKALFGSVTQSLLLNADLSVVAVGVDPD